MRAKWGVGILVTAAALYLLALNCTFRPSAAEAQPPAADPPPAVAAAEAAAASGDKGQQVLMNFTVHASPIFEGGAVGQPVPFTIEIRGPALARQLLPSVQKELAAQVKREIESWYTQPQGKLVPPDVKFDLILQRLDQIEKKVSEFEKASAGRP
jgi:hypothetical protein